MASVSHTRLFASLAVTLWILANCSKGPEIPRTEVFEQAYQVESTARLTIRNLRGSISIRGVDATEMRIKATKIAGSEEQLASINVAVEAEAGSVAVSTNVLPIRKKSLRGGAGVVDYVLTVPRAVKIARLELEDGNVVIEGMEGEDVRANVVDGQLTVRDCCSNVHLGVANGDLDLSYEHCAQRVFVAEAQIMHGNARVSVPREAAFRVRAETDEGSIANDFTDIVQVNGRTTPKIDMVVGKDARSELTLRVSIGDIRIAATKARPDVAAPSVVAAGGN
jgi:DUF4097 and DUF4098 domain-containing protein YvlB